MATPQPGYPPNGQPGQDQYRYEQGDHTQQEAAPVPAAGGRRKRNYAGQAYDFGGGANSALGGQQQGGGAYPGPPGMQPQPQPGYAGPTYGSNPASPGMGGAPSYGQPPPAVGGYQPPDPAYPTHGAPSGQAGMAGVTQGMSNLAMGGQGQQIPQGQMQGRPAMNQLIPIDLLNQHLDVSELSRPPPQINLPPNVSLFISQTEPPAADFSSPASLLLRMLIALQNTFAPRLMLSQQRTRCSKSPDCPSHWSYNPTAHCTTTRTQYRWFQTRLSHDADVADHTSTHSRPF